MDLSLHNSQQLPTYLDIIHQYGRRYDQKCADNEQLKGYIHSQQMRLNDALSKNQELQEQINSLNAYGDLKQKVIDEQDNYITSLEDANQRPCDAAPAMSQKLIMPSIEPQTILSSSHNASIAHICQPNSENTDMLQGQSDGKGGSKKRKRKANVGGPDETSQAES